MKKFKFTLQSVYEYKQTVEEKQKADLKNAQEAVRKLREKEKELENAFKRNAESLDKVLEGNANIPDELAKHDAFFRYLREERKALEAKIRQAEQVRAKCQEALIGTMKEIKTYENLREEQYALYLEELRREEAKEMGDIVSFKTIAGGM